MESIHKGAAYLCDQCQYIATITYYVEFKYILNQSIKEIAIHVLNVNIEQLE